MVTPCSFERELAVIARSFDSELAVMARSSDSIKAVTGPGESELAVRWRSRGLARRMVPAPGMHRRRGSSARTFCPPTTILDRSEGPAPSVRLHVPRLLRRQIPALAHSVTGQAIGGRDAGNAGVEKKKPSGETRLGPRCDRVGIGDGTLWSALLICCRYTPDTLQICCGYNSHIPAIYFAEGRRGTRGGSPRAEMSAPRKWICRFTSNL